MGSHRSWHVSFCLYTNNQEWIMGISILFSIEFNKRHGKKSTFCTIIVNLIETCSIWTRVQFRVFRWWCMVITIWYVRRWDWNVLGKLDQFHDFSEYISMHVCWPIIQWWCHFTLRTYLSLMYGFYCICECEHLPPAHHLRNAANFLYLPSINRSITISS